MSEHGPRSGHVAGDAHAAGPNDDLIEMSPEPFDVTADADGDHGDADADARPGRRSRTRTVVLTCLLAAGLAGAAALGTAGYRISSQKDATIATPDQVAGLQRDTGADARSTAEYLQTALSAEVDLDEAVGAVYTDPAAADRSVLFFGGTTTFWTPGDDLDTAFELVADDAGAVTGLRDVPAGDLGGTMKCGTTTSPDGDIAVCGWADHGSLALAMFPNRSAADSAPLLRTIREQVQTRN